MRGRLLNLLTFLSLLLCMAVVVLWVRSHFIGEWLGKRYLTRTANRIAATDWRMWTGRGSVELSIRRFHWGELADWPSDPRGEWRLVRDKPPADVAAAGPLPSPLNQIGFGVRWETTHEGMFDRAVAMPLWLVSVLLGACPIIWLYRRLRGHREGHCQRCGYDLRGSPGRCPECGDAHPSSHHIDHAAFGESKEDLAASGRG